VCSVTLVAGTTRADRAVSVRSHARRARAHLLLPCTRACVCVRVCCVHAALTHRAHQLTKAKHIEIRRQLLRRDLAAAGEDVDDIDETSQFSVE
jgi:hypothetical protein